VYIADGAAQERDKYAEIWSLEQYRNATSPGLINVDRFMSVIKPDPLSRVIDLGCGSGKAGLELEKRGLRLSWLDITAAGLDPEVPRELFIEQPLWAPMTFQRRWDYGFCCDVLEHLPTEYTLLSISRMLEYCKTLWLQIALRPDNFGALIGEPLHLTVKPFDWWLIRLGTLGHVEDARDLIGEGLYVVCNSTQARLKKSSSKAD
jgi:SAM-dependent methyltransferase